MSITSAPTTGAQDPFERFAFESRMYLRWMADKLWTFLPAQPIVGQFLATFKEFPPSQKSDSLSVDQVLAKLADQRSRNQTRRRSWPC